MRKFYGAAAIAALASASLLVGTIPASAAPLSEPVLNQSEEAQLREFFTTYGVDDEIQDDLVAKVNVGELIDSFGGEPVEVAEHVEDGTSVTVATYEDGSIAVTTLDLPKKPTPEGAITPRYVANCVNTGSNAYQATYQNCSVGHSNGVITMNFEAGYTQFNGAGRIDYVRGFYATTIGYTKSGESLSITRKSSSGTLPATARYKLTAKLGVGPIGATLDCWLQLNVLGGAYTSHKY